MQPLLVIVEPLPMRLSSAARDSLMDASGAPLHVRAWLGPVLDTGTLDDLTLHQQLEQARRRAAQQGRTLGTAALLADAVRPLLTRFSWAKVHQILGQWTAHRITCTAGPGGGLDIAVAGQPALSVSSDGVWRPSAAVNTVTAQGGDTLLAAARHALTQRDAHEMFERLTGAVVLGATPECAWLLPLPVGQPPAPATGLGQLVAQSS
ncbi:hypothetical protein [Deinococcus multiflagellatus]|uniref:Uncharacterized protein n=1 Tax=Deinococcus multiflagellatus TaxID=1656887 RepID=A0ABW1ZU04_9DEIO